MSARGAGSTINLAPNQARQLLNQYAIEKKSAEQAGLDTPAGQSHMRKAEQIRNILYTYSKNQRQAQQQQQVQQQQVQEQQVQQQQVQQQQEQVQQAQQQVQQQAQQQVQQQHNSLPQQLSMQTENDAMQPEIKQEQLQQQQTRNSQQQLHLKKQEILSKYQQVMQMAEKFKSSLAIIQQRKNEPDLDDKTVAYYAEKEKEMEMRIENCKTVTQQIAAQLKIAQQQSNQSLQSRQNSQGITQQPQQLQQAQQAQQQASASVNRTRSASSLQTDNVDQQLKKQKLANGAASSIGGGSPTGASSFARSNTTGNLNASLTNDKTKFDNMNIPDSLKINSSDYNNARVNNRASLLGGNAIYAPGLTIPSMTKGQPFNYDGEQVLNKRKLKELVASVAAEKGDVDLGIDGDVEDLLLDLADEFVQNVTSFAARLARHRHSDNLDVRDVQLPLERTWNIRIPGYSIDEIRMIKKFTPNQSHQSKVNGLNITKSVNKDN